MPIVKPISLIAPSTGPGLLLDLDFREPAQQAFPTTATGVIPGRTASEIFRLFRKRAAI